uniref:Putative ovule protein n=1 Tax=Solanum chacoense TaxID=4108 RepID=A0A0V0I3V6_SOLCH
MMKNRTSQNHNLKIIVDETADLVGNAKLATMRSGPILYSRLYQLPSGIKGPYLLDKMQLPSIRIRYDKANFFVS